MPRSKKKIDLAAAPDPAALEHERSAAEQENLERMRSARRQWSRIRERIPGQDDAQR